MVLFEPSGQGDLAVYEAGVSRLRDLGWSVTDLVPGRTLASAFLSNCLALQPALAAYYQSTATAAQHVLFIEPGYPVSNSRLRSPLSIGEILSGISRR